MSINYDYSRATSEETQVQNMTGSTLPMPTTERRSRDYNHASSSAVYLQTLSSPSINGVCCRYNIVPSPNLFWTYLNNFTVTPVLAVQRSLQRSSLHKLGEKHNNYINLLILIIFHNNLNSVVSSEKMSQCEHTHLAQYKHFCFYCKVKFYYPEILRVVGGVDTQKIKLLKLS